VAATEGNQQDLRLVHTCTHIDGDWDARVLRMIFEALSWYVESITAFWVSMAGGGLFKLLMIWCFIYWICCRRRRCGKRWRRRWRWRHYGWPGPCSCHSGCGHCGCTCGQCHGDYGDGEHRHCGCEDGDCEEAAEPAEAAEAAEPAEAADAADGEAAETAE
jgi:hypothetical protein